MKNALILISFSIFLVSCYSPIKESAVQDSETPVYDSVLAKTLGADDYGMKMYVMALLKSGPNREGTPEERSKLMRGHLDNIKRLAEEGKLVLAGPFGGDGNLRGIYVFDVPTVEEAEELTKTDPAIQAGSLEMELIPWYGTAALPTMDEVQKKISKKSI